MKDGPAKMSDDRRRGVVETCWGGLEEANLPCRTLPPSKPIPGAELVADLKTGVGNSTEAKIGAFRHCRLFNDESVSLGVDRGKW